MEHILGIDLVSLIQSLGAFGVFGIIFAESCLLFFLPGDSLLFTAGFLASQGYFNIWVLVFGSVIAAILGNSVGYTFGRKIGAKIFKYENSFLFNPRNVEKARVFYERHGPHALILARFIPAVRTFVPILAGVGRMRYTKFLVYNIAGGGVWTIGLTVAGYLLGNTIPDVDRYLLPIVAIIIIASLIPAAAAFFKNRKT